MTTALIIIGIAGWLISGYKSFVYWWTHDYDFTNDEISAALFVSLIGPIAFIIGWFIHGNIKGKIINKKR